MIKNIAFGLFSLLVGCATHNNGDINAKYGDMNPASAMRVSGSGISVCTDVGGTVYGLDDDSDTFAVVAEFSDIFADNSMGYADYVCISTSVSGGPKNYIEISSDAMVSQDCNDDDFSVMNASITAYADTDLDGFGNASSTMMTCSLSSGWVADNTDCDDANANAFPGNPEVCDGVDNDCNGAIDNDLTFRTVYEDLDLDTYGNPSVFTATCESAVPTGWSLDDLDCNDGDVTINGEAPEVADDGIDQDCNGSDLVTPPPDPDADSDGYSASTDCDDGDATVNPGATEVSLDGVDNNCDGVPNAEADVLLCGTPVDDLMGVSWQLWTRDGTLDSDGTSTATWALPGINQGTGQLCGTTHVVHGNDQYFNGPFDLDGDSVYDEDRIDTDGDGFLDSGDGVWGFMLTATNLDTSLFTANGVGIVVLPNPYGTGVDNVWLVNLL